MTGPRTEGMHPLPVAILISGRGSNMQSLIRAARHGGLPVDIRLVISDRADAKGIEAAKTAGIETAILDYRGFADRAAFDRALIERIDASGSHLVILAGFMRILTPAFVHHYAGRLLNIHPSLLPDLQGLHTHRRALAGGARQHGASVHFVTEELDGGPVILQARVPVLPGDDEQTLAARVLEQEHRIYPAVVRWFAEGRLRLDGDEVVLDDKPLARPLIWDDRGEVA